MDTRHLSVVGSEGGADGPALPGSATSYSRTVTAALAEDEARRARVKSAADQAKLKFRLAEALATEIPPAPRHRRPSATEEQDVLTRVEEAKQAIIAAGGETRSVNTLNQYRLTALWANWGDVASVNSGWVPDTSYSAHNEARRTGASYEAFRAMTPAERKAIRMRRGSRSTKTTANSARKEQRKAEREALAATREAIRENAYTAMQSAPPGAQNNPMFWRAAKIEALINELRTIDPEVAAGQLVPPAFQYFTPECRDWWDRFTAACEKRREEAGLEPLRRQPVRAPFAETGLDTRENRQDS